MEHSSSKEAARSRRELLRAVVPTAAGLALAGCAPMRALRGGPSGAPEKEQREAEVTSGEDLMQEHGVLERLLLVYDEAARRIESREPVDLGVVASAAGIVR